MKNKFKREKLQNIHVNWMENLFIYNFFYCLAEEDGRRPGQRPATSMLGNEVMSKEQLYDLYQQILGVKKFEHQLLYNAMQVTYVLLKVIYPKYSKHWLSTVAHTIDCVCSKILNHGLNHGLLFSLFKFFGRKNILN